jgi:hypothetical protein
MHELAKLFANTISSGLKQKSLTTCSRWSCANRIMGQPFPGPFSFKYHPWLREIHDAKDEHIIAQKAAQVGFTETALNKTFYKIGVERIDCLYVLPAKQPDATDFSSSRFDVALELSPSLNNLFSDVKNVGHKRAGTANLYVRGSRARGALKSIPVGFIVFDEVDEMDQDNIPLAMERASGQRSYQVLMLSTPTVDGFGINKFFADSTQERYHFRCPCCSRLTELTFPECMVITAEHVNDPRVKDSHYICKECKGRLHHEDKTIFLQNGIWVPQYAENSKRGFQINQMYASSVAGVPENFARAYLKSLMDVADEQEFYNSKLAATHIPDGAKVDEGHILACSGTHRKGPLKDFRFITMGIDVGSWLHVEIDEWILGSMVNINDVNASAMCRVINETKVRDFEDLNRLMREYGVIYAVIDANPERRKAVEFARTFSGHASVCFYPKGVNGRTINMSPDGSPEPSVNVDRVSWLDLSLGRFKSGKILLPQDVSQEYKDHIKEPIRIPKKDEDGNVTYKYVNKGHDHFAHARNYSEIAMRIAMEQGMTSNITRSVL